MKLLNFTFQTVPAARRSHKLRNRIEGKHSQVCSTVTSGALITNPPNTESQQTLHQEFPASPLEITQNEHEIEGENRDAEIQISEENDLNAQNQDCDVMWIDQDCDVDEDRVLREIREIWEESDTEALEPQRESTERNATTETMEPQRETSERNAANVTSSAPGERNINSRSGASKMGDHSAIRDRVFERNNTRPTAGSSSDRGTNLAPRFRGSTNSMRGTNVPPRFHGSTNSMRGRSVPPRLRGSPTRGHISTITRIGQFLDDEGEDEDDDMSIGNDRVRSRRGNRNGSTTRARNLSIDEDVESLARPERDRSNLRNVSSQEILKLNVTKYLSSFCSF